MAYHFISMIQRISKILLIMSFAFFTMALPPRCFAEIVNQPAADAGFQVDNSALSGISNPDQSITNNPAPEIDNDYPCQKIRNPKVPRVKNRSQGIDNDNSGKIDSRIILSSSLKWVWAYLFNSLITDDMVFWELPLLIDIYNLLIKSNRVWWCVSRILAPTVNSSFQEI